LLAGGFEVVDSLGLDEDAVVALLSFFAASL
jgi:hypothetical protein